MKDVLTIWISLIESFTIDWELKVFIQYFYTLENFPYCEAIIMWKDMS
jgi:hypothetical protein